MCHAVVMDQRVRIVHLTVPALRALADGDLATAGATSPVPLSRAAREPRVRTVRASISSGDEASARLVAPYGFAKVGEQWDDEDGLEIVYEVAPVRASRAGAPAGPG